MGFIGATLTLFGNVSIDFLLNSFHGFTDVRVLNVIIICVISFLRCFEMIIPYFVGVFPYVMLTTTLLFLDDDWPRKFSSKISRAEWLKKLNFIAANWLKKLLWKRLDSDWLKRIWSRISKRAIDRFESRSSNEISSETNSNVKQVLKFIFLKQ